MISCRMKPLAAIARQAQNHGDLVNKTIQWFRKPVADIFSPANVSTTAADANHEDNRKISCIVAVTQGSLQGKECKAYNGKKYYSFEGIPYAKPPIGPLRFRAPEEPENWSGIHDATKPGNKCPQLTPSGKRSENSSEDCLFLNVYTPSLPTEKLEKLPVIFFVHGGRYLLGYGDYYKPDYLIQHNAIVVTVNYRLHILGFLCLHIPEVPGNAGIKDTVMALKWVKKNIKYFNGDENNVTAFGESAGAGIVSSYITSKMADGLVHKIIAQSLVSLSDVFMVDDDPIKKAKQTVSVLGQELSDPSSLYHYLRKAPLKDLLLAVTKLEYTRAPHIISPYFLSVVEKKMNGVERFFEELPLTTILNNRHSKIPILLGLNSLEGAYFSRKNSEGNAVFVKDLQKFIPRYLSMKHDSPKSVQYARNLQDFYFKNKDIDQHSFQDYLHMISDAYFNRDVIIFADAVAKYSNQIYFYNFCYSGNMNTSVVRKLGVKGASHGDSLQYQFYRKRSADKCDHNDEKIVNFMNEAWCNFARNGKPTWSNQTIEWVPYTIPERKCLNIDQELTVTQYPYWNRVKFWLGLDNDGERSKL